MPCCLKSSRRRKDKQGEPSGQALDRSVIDELNHSFVQAMDQGSGHGMPHAKLNRMVDDLFDRSIAQGSTHKTLVFVRRIDTVEEIRDLLHVRFQQEMNRASPTSAFLSSPEMAGKPWPADFWQSSGDDGLAPEVELQATLASGDEAQDEGDEPDLPAGAATQNRAFREQPKLAYFEALKQRSETHDINGKLVSFRSRLHSHTDLLHKPLRGFLHRRPAPHGEPVDKDELAWQMNRERWQRLLLAVVGQAGSTSRTTIGCWAIRRSTRRSPAGWQPCSCACCSPCARPTSWSTCISCTRTCRRRRTVRRRCPTNCSGCLSRTRCQRRWRRTLPTSARACATGSTTST